MGIRATYEIARPAFKAHMPDSGRGFKFRSTSTFAMGKPTSKGESKARELLDNNDDWPTRRLRFRSTVKRKATRARRNDSKRLLRELASDIQQDDTLEALLG